MRFDKLFFLALPVLAAAAPASFQNEERQDAFFYKGHDLSSLKMLEDSGAIYKDAQHFNVTRTADAILGSGGMNSVRLRIWVTDGTYGLAYNLDFAKRMQNAGYKIYLDFHFSYTWADPSDQYPPPGWPTELGPLSSTLREYVKNTLVSFHQAGIDLSLVSLGNEIRNGILWPIGEVSPNVEPWSAQVANFSNLATLYKAARAGVDDAVAIGANKPQVLIHIDDGWNLTLQQRWFGALVDAGVPTSAWDVMGFSFYPFYGTAATFANLRESLNWLADYYRKPLQVVETDYPAICNGEYEPIPASSEPEIPYNIQGQIIWVHDVIDIVRAVPYGLGQGVHYWEPAWLNNTSLGSDCNDAILFDADWTYYPNVTGYSRISVDMFNY